MTRSAAVVVTYPGFNADDPATAGALRQAGCSVRFEPKVGVRTPGDVARIMIGASAGIVSTDPFDASVFAACPDLRVLARVGVGTDAIDLDAATRAGVAVTVTPAVNADSVADHAVAMMLACTRRLLQNDWAMRDGRWDRAGALIGTELSGATVGIVGLGATGRAVARRLAGFGATLLGTDPQPVECPGVSVVGLDELLRAADVVTVHVPLVAATRGLLARRELGLMRDGAILVNTSRGGVVDEIALAAALTKGPLRSAGVDVFAHEPPTGSPLLKLDNVVLSPHIGGISVHSQRAMLELATASVLAVIEDRRPDGIVNPDALGGAADRPPQLA